MKNNTSIWISLAMGRTAFLHHILLKLSVIENTGWTLQCRDSHVWQYFFDNTAKRIRNI